MGTNNETVEAPLVDLLIFLSTISNVWLICVIFYKKLHWQSGYLLLLHLAGNNNYWFKNNYQKIDRICAIVTCSLYTYLKPTF